MLTMSEDGDAALRTALEAIDQAALYPDAEEQELRDLADERHYSRGLATRRKRLERGWQRLQAAKRARADVLDGGGGAAWSSVASASDQQHGKQLHVLAAGLAAEPAAEPAFTPAAERAAEPSAEGGGELAGSSNSGRPGKCRAPSPPHACTREPAFRSTLIHTCVPDN